MNAEQLRTAERLNLHYVLEIEASSVAIGSTHKDQQWCVLVDGSAWVAEKDASHPNQGEPQ